MHVVNIMDIDDRFTVYTKCVNCLYEFLRVYISKDYVLEILGKLSKSRIEYYEVVCSSLL